jgi:mobilome CxxCx(11)CxxC protein
MEKACKGDDGMSTQERNDRKDAWKRAFKCFGTAEILKKRQKNIELYLLVNKIIGLIVPASIGFAAITFSIAQTNIGILLTAVSIFSFIQFVLSLVALIRGLESKLGIYIESIAKNTEYSESFVEIGERYDGDEKYYAEYYKKMAILDNKQQENDNKIGISKEEERYGMRHVLVQFGRECGGCHKVPKRKDIKNPKGECSVCGM